MIPFSTRLRTVSRTDLGARRRDWRDHMFEKSIILVAVENEDGLGPDFRIGSVRGDQFAGPQQAAGSGKACAAGQPHDP